MATPGLSRTPYFFLGERTVREARIAAYIRRQHRAARRLSDVLDDPYLRRCANRTLCWHVLMKPETIAMLRRDLFDSRLVQRTRDGREYRRIEQKPPAELKLLLSRIGQKAEAA